MFYNFFILRLKLQYIFVYSLILIFSRVNYALGTMLSVLLCPALVKNLESCLTRHLDAHGNHLMRVNWGLLLLWSLWIKRSISFLLERTWKQYVQRT